MRFLCRLAGLAVLIDLCFSSEAVILKLLTHQFIIKLYETVETKTHMYIATELFEDGTLLDYVKKKMFLDGELESFQLLTRFRV